MTHPTTPQADRAVLRGALADAKPWTAPEKAELVRVYRKGGIEAAARAFPGRSQSSLYHVAHRAGAVRRKRWTKQEDAQLRDLWDGALSVKAIAKRINRTPCTTYWRAQQIGLPLGCPPGWEYLTQAEARTGFDKDTLRRILKAAHVGLKHALSRPTKGGAYHHIIVEPERVDEAIEKWMRAEPIEAAARRFGVCGEVLRRKLVAAGKPRGTRDAKPHVRVTEDDVRRVLAIPIPKKAEAA